MEVTVASLRPFPLLRSGSEEAVAALAARAERFSFVHGAQIWRTGDKADQTHFVVRGLVQALKRLPNGNEASLGLFGPFEVAGIFAILGPGIYPADAIAASDEVQLIRVPTTALKAAIAADSAIARSTNDVLVTHAQLLRAKIDVLTAGEIPHRLATLLLHLADRFGDVTEEGQLVIPVVLSRGNLARLVGAREESVIRVMTRWDREGLVKTVKTGFLVKTTADLEVLQASVD